MKLITILFLSFILGKGCESETQEDLKTTIIEYTANTRGFYQKIVIQNKTISVSKNRDEKNMPTATKLSDADWKFLVTEFQKIKLDKMSTYKGPTEKRFYDGAAIGDFKIVHKDKIYQCGNFDAGTPPVEIAKFVNKVVDLGNANYKEIK